MRGSRCVDTHGLTSHLISLELLSYPLLLIILNLGYVNMQSQDTATCFFPNLTLCGVGADISQGALPNSLPCFPGLVLHEMWQLCSSAVYDDFH